MITEAQLWKARAQGLRNVIHAIWRRGIWIEDLPGFDRTLPHEPQEQAFRKRFWPEDFDR